MELSKRLNAVACLVTAGNRLADVGTDHGYIPIYLVKQKKIPLAIAMDVNKGPLQQAMEHIREEGLEKQIEVRLSDGLKKLEPGEADTVVIAGMGGALTIRILEDGRQVLGGLQELILQPQSEIKKVRYWLEREGFQIIAEDMILEDGKYYPMMKVQCINTDGQGTAKKAQLSELEALYGPELLKKKHPCLHQYLQWERKIKENVLKQLECAGDGAQSRREEVQEALRLNKAAMEVFE